MEPLTKHLRITGRVQGVGFRYSMYYVAQDLGLSGWVKNCEDGSVEAVVQGTPMSVQSIIDWAHKGPSMSRVDFVDVSDDFGQYSTFEIQPL